MYRLWNINLADLRLQKNLSESLDISPILAQLLINRGITTPQEAEDFLNPKLENLSSPFELMDMEIACHRLKKALRQKEKVMIFGDYDVDGITGTVILKSVLDILGFDSFCYLPHRINEGYGLNHHAIKIAKQNDVRLLITVDCGISNSSEVKQLNREGIDVIITDHHFSLEKDLPCALAIINPKRESKGSTYKELSGVGVAYKLACAIMNEELRSYLDLVCLGTVADSVPLRGENRIMVKEGLRVLSNTKREGLRALMEVAGLNGKDIDTFDVAYILAPRLNASGRIDTAYLSLRLLLTDSKEEARTLALRLNQINSLRQRIEEKILKEATSLIEQEINFKDSKVIILAKDGWHEGVLGIIASRIKDMFCRPTVLISLKENICRGSVRSIKNFHIMEALCECRDLLKNFGGHRLAAGLSILKENIEIFKERLNELAKQRLKPEDIRPCLDIDMQITFKDLNSGLLEEIEKLKPFGEANPIPLFYTPRVKLRSKPILLGSRTLKMWVTDGNFTYPALSFNKTEVKPYLSDTDYFDLVYSIVPSRNSESTFKLIIEDIRCGPSVKQGG